MTQPAIDVQNLSKSYDDVLAVKSISFSVKPGETVALLGGNGAGKTTTISMLLGILLPTAGTVRLLGEDIARDRYRVMHRINFSSPYVDLPRRLTVRQNLIFFCKLYGIVNAKERIMALCEELDLRAFIDRPTGSLSAGQKTRVSVAKALVNNPEILLLDEPTASLDPDTADWVRSYLKNYQSRHQAAILLASHNMSEVERICDNVLMMKRGRIVDQGTPTELLHRYSRTNLEEVFLDIARDRVNPDRQDSDLPGDFPGDFPGDHPRDNLELGDI
ncbi:ABC transporter ATP-binding protein [Kiloniella antarctica]|uniref:ABC transporter ATP-binding protein n=1 Tax=Kiloniella antarctica TaxID=1550907 RepID=A0ABW5BGE6_9PROT